MACALPAAAQEPALAQRLSQIEEQIVDLQVAIATLQSLRGSTHEVGAAPRPFGENSDMELRVEALETQIRALTGQIEHLGAQIAALQARPVGGQDWAPTGAPGGPSGDMRGQVAPSVPHGFAGSSEPPADPEPRRSRFGITSVLPWATQRQDPPQSGDRVAALSGGDARDLYEEAYGHLLSRDYESAENGFRRFLDAHPDDALAGDAQYWLGETHFVRGQYKRAADAFLRSYRHARTGAKAPDSLLKLGMSLSQIGEREAACDTFGELAKSFPDAPEHVRQRAVVEGRRAGC